MPMPIARTAVCVGAQTALAPLRHRLLVIVGALLITITGTPAPARDNLTIGITQFPSTLHPNIDSMLAKTYVLAMTQRPITAYDVDWQLICMLCTTLPTLENGLAEIVDLADDKRGVKLTYSLHPEATWGDGTPVSTTDVLFTWDVGRHPKAGVSNAELYSRITDIEIVDDKTFILDVNKLTYAYNAINDFRLLPAHLDRAVFEADPENYRRRTLFDTDPTNPGLAYGPYRIVDLSSGAFVSLAPNPTWYGREPAFDRVTVRTIENTAALEANLLSGDVDMIAGELGLPIDQALAFAQRHDDRFKTLYKSGLIYEHVELNLDNPILADLRVRRALLHAIDRQRIVDRLFKGRQPVADTGVSPLDWIYTDDVARYPYDPVKAAALLDAAGWSQRRDGIRHNADGAPLRLTFMTTAGNRTRELVQQIMQNQWKAAGVDVQIRNQPARILFGETVTRRKFTGMVMFAWISAPENLPRTTLHSTMIPTADNGWAGQNYTGLSDPRFDALIDAIELELDRDARKALWHRLQAIYADDLPVLPLYYRANPFILPVWLDGVVPTGHQGPTTLWIENWSIAR